MLKKLWEKVKTWAVNKLWPWFKREWVTIGSIVVLIICYGVLPEESGLGALVGFWLFVLGAVGLWRLFSKTKP
jgi:hypothetical protein